MYCIAFIMREQIDPGWKKRRKNRYHTPMDRHFLTFLSRNPILNLGSGIIVFSFLLIILAMSGVFSPAIVTPFLALFLASSLFSLLSFWRSIPWKERLGLICMTVLTIGIVSFFSYRTDCIHRTRSRIDRHRSD
jgi:sterol desaturase/sphingolipid hydroxylase (fatty acid hydroxylase superfamily)